MASLKRTPKGAYRVRWRELDGTSAQKDFPLRRDANRFKVKVENDLATGAYTSRRLGKTLFADYAEEYVASRVDWRDTSEALARSVLRTHLAPELGAVPVSNIKTADMSRLSRRWVADGAASTTIRNRIRILKVILAAAFDDGLIPSVPKSPRLPSQKKKIEIPTWDEVDALTKAMPERWRASIPLLANSGLRNSEMLGLRVHDVNFFDHKMQVRNQMGVGVHAGQLVPPKTEASIRDIPLPPSVIEWLSEHLARRPAPRVGPIPELLFSTDEGRPLSNQGYARDFRKAREAIGLPNLVPHHLRHLYGSTLVSRGVNIKSVQTWLGHTTAAMTLDTYGHYMPGAEDQAREALAEAAGEGGGHHRLVALQGNPVQAIRESGTAVVSEVES